MSNVCSEMERAGLSIGLTTKVKQPRSITRPCVKQKTLSPQEGQPQSPERQCGVGPAQTAKLMSPLRAMLQSPPGARTICTLSPRRVLSCSKNFTSTGAVAFKSVVAGDMKATLSIDDGRCTTSVTEPYSSPFEGTHTAQVACLISDARTVNTSMEGCIPQRCATGRGSLSAVQSP